MSLVTIDEVRALVTAANAMSDEALQAVIDRVEAEITAWLGAPQDENLSVEVTERIPGNGGQYLMLKRRPVTVTSVLETVGSTTDRPLEAAAYRVHEASGMLERLLIPWYRIAVYTVTYVPRDESEQRKGVIIDPVRLDIERTAQYQEAVGGEYSHTAPGNWESERARVKRRLRIGTV